MKYQKIFWLEDTPHILGEVLRICSGHNLDKDSLFSRITFAPDYQAGAEIVHKQDFDLYILDADFPDATREGWKEQFWQLMQQVSADTGYMYFKDRFGEGYIGHSTNNFAPFFDEFLSGRKEKTIVYSTSTIAPAVAFHYGLPFYSKAMEKDGIKENITKNVLNKRILHYLPHLPPKNLDFLEQWEYGSRFDLVKNYLL